MRRTRVTVAVGALVATLGILPALPAQADTGCPAGLNPAAAQQLAGLPWAQQRYDLTRLTGIADGRGVTVAVIDSGVDAGAPQLRGRVDGGIDELVPGGDGRQDCVGHGTAVASLIAAGPDGTGSPLRGVAPAVRVLPVRVTETGTGAAGTARAGSAHGLADGIRAAVDRGARVLNISMVLGTDESPVREAVRYAVAHRVVVVAAAGNGHRDDGGPDPVAYPAGYPGVIGVGAVNEDGRRLAESQTGGYVRLAAPGGLVTAAVPGGGLATFSGTSFAVPFVAGAAALVLQRYPTLTPDEVAARLYATADPPGDSAGSASYGHGIVNPYRAATGAGPQPSLTRPAPALVAQPSAPRQQPLRLRPALLAAGAGVLGAALLVLLAVVLPRGAQRGWRPGS